MNPKIPLFTEEVETYIVEKVAAGKMPLELANAIFERYPEFQDIDGMSDDEVIRCIYKRLDSRKNDKRFRSYWIIRDAQEDVQSEIETIDIADPIEQLRMLDALDKQMAKAESDVEIDRLKGKIQARLKIMSDARKLVELLMPKEDEPFDTDPDDIPEVKKRKSP